MDSEVVPSNRGAELAAAAGRRRRGTSRAGSGEGIAARAPERLDVAVLGCGAGGDVPGCAGLPPVDPDCGGAGFFPARFASLYSTLRSTRLPPAVQLTFPSCLEFLTALH